MMLTHNALLFGLVLLLLSLGGASNANVLRTPPDSINVTLTPSLDPVSLASSRISRRSNEILINHWRSIPEATEDRLNRLAPYGIVLNNIIMADVEGARPLFRQINKGGDDPRGTDFQRSVKGHSGVIARKWTIHEVSQELGHTLDHIKPLLQGLSVGYEPGTAPKGLEWQIRRSAKGDIYPHGPNVCLRAVQDKPYKSSNGADRAATKAQYDTWFNIVDGIIIVNRAWGPEYMIRSPRRAKDWAGAEKYDASQLREMLPAVYHWSDIIFQLLMTHMRPRPDPPPPALDLEKMDSQLTRPKAQSTSLKQMINFIIVQGITDPREAISVIKRCLSLRSGGSVVPVWPAKERFDVGHWCFDALLAVEGSLGPGIAYFLAQHKADPNARDAEWGIGRKMLAYVEITSGLQPGWGTITNEDGSVTYVNHDTGQMWDTKPADYDERKPDPANDHYWWSPTLIWKVIDYDPRVEVEAHARERIWTGGRGQPPYNYCDMPTTTN